MLAVCNKTEESIRRTDRARGRSIVPSAALCRQVVHASAAADDEATHAYGQQDECGTYTGNRSSMP